MRHLRDEARRRLEDKRGGRLRSWSLWLRNLLLLAIVIIVMRHFGTQAAPAQDTADTPAEYSQEVSP
ncbi:MAG: hypothetical protein K8R90_07370 [Candidatus Cloacimonetes bacterium]|nr:hypothetical protein [Candidatus Cloacimonadota bacterium]